MADRSMLAHGWNYAFGGIKNGFFIFRPGQGYEYVLMTCAGAGGVGAALTLLTCWRPAPAVAEPTAANSGAEPTAAA